MKLTIDGIKHEDGGVEFENRHSLRQFQKSLDVDSSEITGDFLFDYNPPKERYLSNCLP